MKTYIEYLQEQKIPKKFEDSGDATDYVYTLNQMLEAPGLLDWQK